MLASDKLSELAEFESESIFTFDSKQDFFDNIAILAGTEAKIVDYLETNNFKLSAKRRINVFRKPYSQSIQRESIPVTQRMRANGG